MVLMKATINHIITNRPNRTDGRAGAHLFPLPEHNPLDITPHSFKLLRSRRTENVADFAHKSLALCIIHCVTSSDVLSTIIHQPPWDCNTQNTNIVTQY